MTILSLFDLSGNMVRPWAKAGYHCAIVDTQHAKEGMIEHFPSGGTIMAINMDLSKPDNLKHLAAWKRPKIVFSFPPCTDLAVSGAAHFAKKRAANPRFQDEATALATVALNVAFATEKHNGGFAVPYFAENPISRLATIWRKPNHYFNPCDYGGYLSDAEAYHPKFPDIIPARDAYNKKTCLWSGNGFIMPEPKPVKPISKDSPLHTKLGGKSLRTKNIRSQTPRGFAKAVFEANRHSVETLTRLTRKD